MVVRLRHFNEKLVSCVNEKMRFYEPISDAANVRTKVPSSKP